MIFQDSAMIDGMLLSATASSGAILFTIIIFSLGVTVISLRNRRIPGAISLVLLSVDVAVWSSAYLLYSVSNRLSVLGIVSVDYLCATVAATALLTLSLAVSSRGHWLTRSAIVLLAVEPLVTQLLFWVEPWRRVLFVYPGLPAINLGSTSSIRSEIVFIYLYSLELISIILLIDTFTRKPRKLLFQSSMILLGASAPLLLQLFAQVGVLPAGQFDYLLLGYWLSVLGFAYTIHRGKLIDGVSVTREAVVEGMTDGWMVLDINNNIIDINPAAESILGFSRLKVYGKPVNFVLPDWPGLSDAPGGFKEFDMRRSIRIRTDWRYLNIRLSNLRDKNQKSFGKLIVWRDITERRLTDDARQRARDEMFVILHALSNAATHATSLDEFLSEALYQIIYPFQTQIAAIFIVGEDDTDVESKKFHLASQFGLTPEAAQGMSEIPVPSSLLDTVLSYKRPFLIDDVPNEVRIRFAMRGLGISNFLIVPLMIHAKGERKMIGCLALARKDQVLYNQDEIIRLSPIADQIATLIDSDRRRQLSTARLERQRLLRDLHDSVSQKLYGLVALTEAAQAAQEAGSSVVPSDVLNKIGDNARLAVKEMRLFLYEMQPVDLEKEGLVSILHQRLAAVEGRADIKARLLADENISLGKEKEIALYYVAQEALNNVLKHAHATTVSVRLRKTPRNVILEVVDDGRGFDPKKLELGGLGLKNMKERIALVHGRLKIDSNITTGTKIKVTVGRERAYIQKGRRGKP